MTVPSEFDTEPRVIPAHLLVAAGLSVNAFENLSPGYRAELLRLRLSDAAETVEVAEKALADARRVFLALVAVKDQIEEVDPEKTRYRVLEQS